MEENLIEEIVEEKADFSTTGCHHYVADEEADTE